MSFQWPDPISLVADVITFVGFPTLVVSTIQLYKEVGREREEARKEREEARRARGVSEDCVTFFDVESKCAINSVPFKKTGAIPRVGDNVYLPGERDGDRSYGDGKYRVLEINFHYREDREAHPFIPASASAIEIHVRKITSLS
ncbi:MAG: hypothetical protein ACYC46_12545 [Acidobacteriaceae bacterium]